ncbi:MAG: hypothetical protein HY661_19235 [Betaproteobacteria bacterium]|nr:hypothetical protein [Betaproteobacteria bacterium]
MTTKNDDPQVSVTPVLRRVLRPLVRLMLARGLTFPFVAELLKGLFVEVADEHFRLDGDRQTVTRVSLLTGVHRKDVKRLRSNPESSRESFPENISLGAQLIAAWNADAKFLDDEGRPRPLPRFSGAEGEPSFDMLVRSVSTDIHPRAVLDEWLRLGVAAIDDQNRVRLKAEVFVPEKGFEEKMFYFGHNLHDHSAASVHNVLGEQPPLLERCVHFSGVSPDDIERIAQAAEKHGMQALRGVNNRANQLFADQSNSADPPMRMTFGVYLYYEPELSAEESTPNATA